MKERYREPSTSHRQSAYQNTCTVSLLMRRDVKYCKTGWLGRELSMRAKIQENHSRAGTQDVGGQ